MISKQNVFVTAYFSQRIGVGGESCLLIFFLIFVDAISPRKHFLNPHFVIVPAKNIFFKSSPWCSL